MVIAPVKAAVNHHRELVEKQANRALITKRRIQLTKPPSTLTYMTRLKTKIIREITAKHSNNQSNQEPRMEQRQSTKW